MHHHFWKFRSSHQAFFWTYFWFFEYIIRCWWGDLVLQGQENDAEIKVLRFATLLPDVPTDIIVKAWPFIAAVYLISACPQKGKTTSSIYLFLNFDSWVLSSYSASLPYFIDLIINLVYHCRRKLRNAIYIYRWICVYISKPITIILSVMFP